MVLDRALSPALLDTALRVATEADESKDARRLLTVALRDQVSAQEAEGKTKKCLSRIWVHPPELARPMIKWAVEHQDLDHDRIVLHFVAMLATFPFAGVVASLAGRQLHLEEKVEPREVKAAAKSALGDRSTIEVGARKVLTTMRYLGLLSGPDGGPFVYGRQPVVPAPLAAWVTHALLLTRHVHAVAVDDPARAFEFATLKVGTSPLGEYPLLEQHTEGNRTVAVVRRSV